MVTDLLQPTHLIIYGGRAPGPRTQAPTRGRAGPRPGAQRIQAVDHSVNTTITAKPKPPLPNERELPSP